MIFSFLKLIIHLEEHYFPEASRMLLEKKAFS